MRLRGSERPHCGGGKSRTELEGRHCLGTACLMARGILFAHVEGAPHQSENMMECACSAVIKKALHVVLVFSLRSRLTHEHALLVPQASALEVSIQSCPRGQIA